MHLNPTRLLPLGLILALASTTVTFALIRTEAGGLLYGDANCDASVNSIDSALVLQFGAGLSPEPPCAHNADVNGDGSIGSLDSALILQFGAGLLDRIGPSGPSCIDQDGTGCETETPNPTVTPAATFTPAHTATPTATSELLATPTPAPTAAATATATNAATPTGEPTATGTPTLTPTSAPTATATPGPEAGTVFARNSSWYTDALGAIWVVGEVVNDTDSNVSFVEVSADFYSSTGTLLTTDAAYACLDTIGPHSDSSFTSPRFGPPPGVAEIQVRITDYIVDSHVIDPPLAGISVDETYTYIDLTGYLHLVGTVTNNSNNTYDHVAPCTAFYNASGNVVRTHFLYTSPRTLAPGQSGTFDSFVNGQGKGIVSYRIWIDGRYR